VEEGISAREDEDSDGTGSEEAGSGSMEAGSGSVEGSGVAAGLDSDETSLLACSAID